MKNKWKDPRYAMKAPEGYFEDFENKLMNTIGKEEPKLKIWRSSWVGAVAAVMLLIIIVLFVVQWNSEKQRVDFAELTLEENWDYLLEYTDELTFEDFDAFEETEEALQSLEQELYGFANGEEFLNEIDLETIEILYE
ncbi:hypothetical protein [Portibacter marinus]|uniref:hypothetical protein n=1 Tax=Portibacter marinus TaxID=2898660 RepID=UPI001F1F442F|nr:hypothetical protein [Portibacter marinus]